jgi:hypothetical protein
MTTLRAFGLELECFNPRVDYQTSGTNIARAINAMGFRAVRTDRHFDAKYDVWQIKPDVSLTPVGQALEVVAPTLPGTEESLEQVRKVATWLGQNGYDVNRSCGFHIHLDARDITPYEAAAIAWRYTARIADFNAILPSSRHSTRWGAALTGAALDKVTRAASNPNSRESWGHGERYAAVNLQHLDKPVGDKRIEFRQHSGTLNPTKIIGFYRLLCDFVAETLRIVRQPTTATAIPAPTTVGPARIIRNQRRRAAAATTSVVVGRVAPGTIPTIERDTDYDMFLTAIEERGVVTQNDARNFGWPDTRLRVTAHWLRRNGAHLITTERNGELAYVAANGARSRAAIFSLPAQVRQRVTVNPSAPSVAAPAPRPSSDFFDVLDRASVFDVLRQASVLQGASPESSAFYRQRLEDFSTT